MKNMDEVGSCPYLRDANIGRRRHVGLSVRCVWFRTMVTEAWNLSLFDESVEPYGPKGYEPPRYVRTTKGKNSEAPTASNRMDVNTGTHPAGTPPLDWWVIDG